MTGPVRFQRKFLGRQLWSVQQEICRSMVRYRSLSVKGCHGSGKTHVVAGMVVYELLANENITVLTIAPTLRQVKLLWSEITAAIEALPIRVPEPTTTGWELSEKCKAVGFSSSKGVNAQGFHGQKVLIIADEALGISGDLWDAIEGVRMAGDVRIVKLCNPTSPSGVVFKDFTSLRGTPGHKCITISAFDTPNLKGLTMESLLKLPEEDLDYAPFPALTRRRAVLELYHKWGPTNPRFISRVLGEFPQGGDDLVYNTEWITKAELPYEPEDLVPYKAAGLTIQVGLDVAGAGSDETVATARLGPFVVGMEAWPQADPFNQLLAFFTRLIREFPHNPIVVVADTVGVGHHLAMALARRGMDVRAFIANAAPINPVLFRDAKAEGYFQLRDHLRDGHVIGLSDEDTKSQLSDIHYREVLGRVEIESKKEMKARGVSSPDRVESLVMAYVRLQPRQEVVLLGSGYQISAV